jgi:hypothetical protein
MHPPAARPPLPPPDTVKTMNLNLTMIRSAIKAHSYPHPSRSLRDLSFLSPSSLSSLEGTAPYLETPYRPTSSPAPFSPLSSFSIQQLACQGSVINPKTRNAAFPLNLINLDPPSCGSPTDQTCKPTSLAGRPRYQSLQGNTTYSMVVPSTGSFRR